MQDGIIPTPFTDLYFYRMDAIDLRSDTVTRPTPAMRDAMASAELGDDVFGEDPSVNRLQDYAAGLFGTEAALFCSSGTQTNQIAIAAHTRPGDEVICSHLAHIYLYEGGGIAANSGCSVRLIGDDRGMFTGADLHGAFQNPEDIHLPVSRLVSIEDTVNKGGGAVWDAAQIRSVSDWCRERGLALHADGARLFNALRVTGLDPAEYARSFDSISICLSKGLGAPVGSLLLGSAAFISRARRIRKRLGGGMRQAGMLAAAGLHALQHHVERLDDDHRRASALGAHLASLHWVTRVMPVQTNIVIFQLREGLNSPGVVSRLAKSGIRCFPFGPDRIRMVLHLDISDDSLGRAMSILAAFDPQE